MVSSGYRVKLYGHSTDDADAFSKSLAVVLNKEPDEALRTLLSAPVIVADGLERRKAEHLAAVIESIKGLCLVEPTEGGAPDTDTDEVEPPGREGLEAVPSDQTEAMRERGERASNIWQWILVALGAGSIVFAIVAYFSVFQEVHERVTPSKTPSEIEKTEKEAAGQDVEAEDPSVALTQEIGVLQEKLGVLRDRIEEQRALVKSLYSATEVDRHMFMVEQRKLAGLRNQFGQFIQRLSELKTRLEKTDKRQKQLDGMQTQ